MAVLEARVQEEAATAGDLKVKHILVDDESGTRKYIKVGNVSKVKTGKHGAAKVMVSGNDLKSGKQVKLTYNGGQSVLCASLTKKQFVLEDVHDFNEALWMRPNDNSGIECDSYFYNQWDEEDVKKIMDAWEKHNREHLLVTIVMAPGYISFEDIRLFKQYNYLRKLFL